MNFNIQDILKKLIQSLFCLALFFLPFNSEVQIPFVGEFRGDSIVIFLLLGTLVIIVKFLIEKKIAFPLNNSTYVIFFVFLLWLILCTVFNLETVGSNYFKQTSGLDRFLRQFSSIILSSIFFFSFYYNVIRGSNINDIFKMIRTTFLISFVIVSSYLFLEIAILKFNFYQAYSVLKMFNYFPFVRVNLDFGFNRISGPTSEVPALAMYLITVAGWMFSYIITAKSIWKYVPAFLVLFFGLISGSRTSLVVIIIQFIIFIFHIISFKKHYSTIISFITVLIAIISISYAYRHEEINSLLKEKSNSLNFLDVSTNVSNKSRLGIQYTSFKVFTENPIIGVGFGQQAYHSYYRYPYWARRNNWEFKYNYLDQKKTSFPPGYNIYTRILAETGIIGFILFIIFIISFFKEVKVLRNQEEYRTFSIILSISMVGFLLNWLQIDSFRIYGVWICLAVLCVLTQDLKKFNNEI